MTYLKIYKNTDMMKGKNWIAFLLFTAVSVAGFAQPGPDEMDEKRKDKIETLKRAYISEKLELTVAEAEKFWPVYNEFDAQKGANRKSIKQAEKKLKEGSRTEKDAIATIDLIGQKRKEEVDLDSKFFKDCLPILGVDRVMKLAGMQKEFQQELMRRMKDKREEMRQNGEPGPRPRRN